MASILALDCSCLLGYVACVSHDLSLDINLCFKFGVLGKSVLWYLVSRVHSIGGFVIQRAGIRTLHEAWHVIFNPRYDHISLSAGVMGFFVLARCICYYEYICMMNIK
uniref:Uncharacterized protein n=1 Tax=Cacopsylla melanoneura TaxID=428564 RepID=A0A8D9E994_9HEMI